MPELESRKFTPSKRRSSTGVIQYGEKQRRFSDSTKPFNTRIVSEYDQKIPQSQTAEKTHGTVRKSHTTITRH